MRVSSGAWLYDPASAAGHRVPRQRATFRYFLVRCTALIPRTRPAGRATAMARLPLAVRAAALVGTVLAFTFRLASLLAGQGSPYLHSGPKALVFIGGSALTGASLVLGEALLKQVD